MKPIVAIIGRPNVGKSTLFNRITGTRKALVDNMPGVTRDRISGDATWNGVDFKVVDTGGFTETGEDDFSAQIRRQVGLAIAEADVVVLVLDGRGGVSPFDAELVQMVRHLPKPMLYAVNKIDGEEKEPALFEFFDLGIDDFHPVSAEHGYGMSDFLDALVPLFPPEAPEPSPDITRIAVVGRPNVGKSSLINRLLGEERLLVSEIPGTTRDAIDTVLRIGEKAYLLIDTAGIRRKGKVSEKLEKFSVMKALRSLERCHVALIVLDASEGVTEQDIAIAGYAFENGCACIFLLNKWDLAEPGGKAANEIQSRLRSEARFLGFAPVLTVSALAGLNMEKIFPVIDRVYGQYAARIGTGQINRIFAAAVEKNEPSIYKGNRVKFFYAAQISERPPTFVSFVNHPEAVHFSYKRYLINQIRKETGLLETPLRLIFRKREGRLSRGPGRRSGA
jgi:GTPase